MSREGFGPPNLNVEFSEPQYFVTLLDWTSITGIVYWRDGTRTIGVISFVWNVPEHIEVRTENGEIRTGAIADALKIYVGSYEQ